jgi:hypothetical protein
LGKWSINNRGLGTFPNKQKMALFWLTSLSRKLAQTEPIAFCDSTGPRLLLGGTGKRNVPKTLVYQAFWNERAMKKRLLMCLLAITIFRHNNESEQNFDINNQNLLKK